MKWYSPSAIALVIANLLPLYGVVFWGWSVLALLVLFWLEVIVVGLLAVLRMLIASPGSDPPPVRNFAWILGFCILYAVFVAGLGIMMFSFFGDPEGAMPFEGLWPALAALGASHVFSFFWNYVGHGEYRRAKLRDLMWAANSRVFILFFSLFFGALFLKVGSPVWGLAILIGFKTWLDLATHVKEHRAAPEAAVTT